MKKICSKCKEEKDIIEFRKDKYRKDGHKSRCKYCTDNIHTHTCKQCGNTFTCSKKSQDFCSYECMGKSNINKIKFNCDYCGKESECIKSEFERNEHHYCSRECTDKHRSILQSGENHPNWKGGDIEFYCDYCRVISYTDVAHYNSCENHFCSSKCLGKYKSISNIGKNNPNYNLNKTDEERLADRKYKEYEDFVQAIYKRDNYACQCCGKEKEVSGHLNAHHLNSYNWDIENRTNIDNGITLCDNCHKEFHNQYGYGNNTKVQYKEFINNKNKKSA